MKINRIKFISLFLLLGLLFVPVGSVLARDAIDSAEFEKPEQLSEEANAGSIINTVVGYLSAILAGLFVLMMIVGAIWYMVFPDPGKKQEGMKIIQSAIIAGVFALLSYAIWNILKAVL